MKNKASICVGILLSLFTLLFFIQSFGYDYIGSLGPGPGFFPVWISGILLVLCLLYIYESIKGNSAQEALPKGKALKNVLFILSCMVVFILLITFLGFILTSTIFLFALLYREYKWYSSLGISVGVSIFLFWLFGSVLQVALPVNGFGW